MKSIGLILLTTLLISTSIFIMSCCDPTEPENNAPQQASSPYPIDGAVDQPVDVDLNWIGIDQDGDTVTFDLYMGTDTPPPLVEQGQTHTGYNSEELFYDQTYYWQVNCYDREDTTEGQIWSFTTESNLPPAVPGNFNPNDNTLDVPLDAQLSWNCSDPEQDTLHYNIHFGENPDPPLAVANLDTNVYSPNNLNFETTYYWKVIAQDEYGNESNSNVLQFTTLAPANQVPNLPTAVSPADNATDQPLQNVSLSWNCIDPDGDPLTYDVFFGTTRTLSLISEDQNTNQFALDLLEYGTTYYWKILAVDNRGGAREGAIWSFTTIPNPQAPTVPSNPSPVDGSVDQPTEGELSWDCTDPDFDPVTYDVYFGTSSNPPLVSDDQVNRTYEFNQLDILQTYYWRIVAKDNHDHITYGPLWEFTTFENNPPNLPENPTPPNGANNQPLELDLIWTCTDNDGDDMVYDVFFGTNNNPPLVSEDQAETRFDPGRLDYSETYFWKITATDEDGDSTVGDVWSFSTTANLAPDVPSNPTPNNQATDQPINLIINWECTDPFDDVLVYDVFLGTDQDPPQVTDDQAPSRLNATGLIDYGETYYWKIIANDMNGMTSESPIWSFSTAAGVQPNSVTITTAPPGASIHLDGSNTEQVTPAVIRNVTPGDHAIRLYLDEYNEYSEEFTLNADDTHDINIQLETPQYPLPTISIDQPANNAQFNDNIITVSGTVDLEDEQNNPTPYDGGNMILWINGSESEVTVTNGNFTQDVSIISGDNAIQLRATSAAGNTGLSAPVNVIGDFEMPDIEVILTWNTQNVDLDLHIWNPNNEHCYHSNREITEGSLNLDDVNGFGPEVFTAENAIVGTYVVQVNCFALRGADYTDASVQLNVSGEGTQNYGPHRFTVSDANGQNPDAWWEPVTFEISNNVNGYEIRPISPERRAMIRRDIQTLVPDK